MNKHYLKQTYKTLYPHLNDDQFVINSIIRKFYAVTGPIFRYGSYNKPSHQSCFVLANWAQQNHIEPSDNTDNQTPGQVQYYFLHSIMSDSQPRQHLFAYTLWYEPHLNKDSLAKPLHIWYRRQFQSLGASTFLPIQQISNRFIFYSKDSEEEHFSEEWMEGVHDGITVNSTPTTTQVDSGQNIRTALTLYQPLLMRITSLCDHKKLISARCRIAGSAYRLWLKAELEL